MKQGNIFEGGSAMAQLAIIIYQQLMSREWVDSLSVMREYYMGRPLPRKLSACENYGELKKAFMYVRQTLEEKIPDCLIEEGNNRSKRFRYQGEASDPLADLKNAATIRDLKTYFEFCQDSAGLMPIEWMEHFFKNTNDLLQIHKKRKNSQQLIYTEDRHLTNIRLLPIIYEYILAKRPCRINYKPFNSNERERIIHPHFLREYNGRWFVFGYEEGRDTDWVSILALDRIMDEIGNVEGVEYVPPNWAMYRQRFEHTVGVSFDKNEQTIYNVRVRAFGIKMWGLIQTKPLHSTQQTGMDYDENLGYGEVILQVTLNLELMGRILYYGELLEVVEPQQLRDSIREKVKKMNVLYKK